MHKRKSEPPKRITAHISVLMTVYSSETHISIGFW